MFAAGVPTPAISSPPGHGNPVLFVTTTERIFGNKPHLAKPALPTKYEYKPSAWVRVEPPWLDTRGLFYFFFHCYYFSCFWCFAEDEQKKMSSLNTPFDPVLILSLMWIYRTVAGLACLIHDRRPQRFRVSTAPERA